MKINKSKILGSRKIKKKSKKIKIAFFFLGLLLSFLYAWKLATFTVMFVQNRLFLFLPLSSLFFQSTGHVREHCVIAVTAKLFCFFNLPLLQRNVFLVSFKWRTIEANHTRHYHQPNNILDDCIRQTKFSIFFFFLDLRKQIKSVFLKICKNPARAKTQAFR